MANAINAAWRWQVWRFGWAGPGLVRLGTDFAEHTGFRPRYAEDRVGVYCRLCGRLWFRYARQPEANFPPDVILLRYDPAPPPDADLTVHEFDR